MQFSFFSDYKRSHFLPLTLTRPIEDLRVGIFTIKEKWEYHFGAKFESSIIDTNLQSLFPSKVCSTKHSCIWINSRFLPNPQLIKEILSLTEGKALVSEDEVIAAVVNGAKSLEFQNNNSFEDSELEKVDTNSTFDKIDYLWDLTTLNAQEISNDIPYTQTKRLSKQRDTSHFHHQYEEEIYISEGAVIEPGCVLIAKAGPIFIGKNAILEAGSIIRGPVAICDNAVTKMASRISEGTTVGPVCKVGGEVMTTIFHSYSNKAHDGFVGNSIIGQWCNLGANTITSNLKNNYSNVSIPNWESQELTDTGKQFLGSIMADHSRTSINTTLNTGTVCGVCSSIFALDFPPKVMGSFSWVTKEGSAIYDFDKALVTMQMIMKRRNVELTESYKNMMKEIFLKSHAEKLLV